MTYILRVLSKEMQEIGYISEVDFEINGPDYPTGAVEFTENPDDAMKFKSLYDAVDFIHTRPRSCPTRPDGEPNKPLTALNLEVVDVEDCGGMDRMH